MNLMQIRKLFRDISGRYDLVNDDLSNNGADDYINEASRWLDRQIKTSQELGKYLTLLSANSWNLQFPDCRGVKEVWLTTTEGRYELHKLDLREMIQLYYRDIPANWTAGTPIAYSLTNGRNLPVDISAETLATMITLVGLITSTGDEYDAIILSCPVEVQSLVEIRGNFYSKKLEEDDDTNFWTSVHPMLLVNAAVRQVYVASGNKVLLDITETTLRKDLADVEKDLVESEIAEVTHMREWSERRH